MELELNYTWIQELLKEIKLEISDYDITMYHGLSSDICHDITSFSVYIHLVLFDKLGFKKGKALQWNLEEFLTLCIVFNIEEIVSKLKMDEELNKSTYPILEFKNLKIERLDDYYKRGKEVLKFPLKFFNRNSLRPFQWIEGVGMNFVCYLTNQVIKPEEYLFVSQKLKKYIYYQHYFKLDHFNFYNLNAIHGILPEEIFSLEEALDFLEINENNLLRRCFLDNVGIYCRTDKYKFKKTFGYDFVSPLMSYAYYFQGFERLYNGNLLCPPSDCPVKKLWKSGRICVESGESQLAVPLQLSLGEICEGVSEKNIILYYGQQITLKDLFFLKSDIAALKTKYPSNNKNSEINSPLLKDFELGVKTREKNQKFAQMASKQKTQIAKHRWKESLDCARSIARDKPNHYSASDLARLVAKRKPIPGKPDTLRKKILQDKHIVTYLKQIQKVT